LVLSAIADSPISFSHLLSLFFKLVKVAFPFLQERLEGDDKLPFTENCESSNFAGIDLSGMWIAALAAVA
jgi:hypothetical protein